MHAISSLLLVSLLVPFSNTLSVLTWNVRYDSTHPRAQVEFLQQQDADIICLQEVTPGLKLALVNGITRTHPHSIVEPRTGTWGVGIISKHPMTRSAVFQQSPHRMPAAEAWLNVNGTRLLVVCVYLFPPLAKRDKSRGWLDTNQDNARLRLQQACALVERYKDVDAPKLVVGDFNEEQGGDAVQYMIAHGFMDACGQANATCRSTYPAHLPVVPAMFQIDHVLGQRVLFTGARVLAPGLSDHHAVLAQLELQTAPVVPR